jgi:hypothetical protein
MNILNMIKEQKGKLNTYLDNKEQARTMKEAEQLQYLRKERIKLEGRENIHRLKDKEQSRITKSKQNLRKRTPTYRVMNAIKDNLKKAKTNKRKMGTLPGKNWNF